MLRGMIYELRGLLGLDGGSGLSAPMDRRAKERALCRCRCRLLRRLFGISTRGLQPLIPGDDGSGTMAGVALILLVGVLLGAVASAGNLLICQANARSAADLAALSAAVLLRNGSDDPCAVALAVASANAVRLDKCDVDIEDVQVTVVAPTQVPFASYVSRTSRAGPVVCG